MCKSGRHLVMSRYCGVVAMTIDDTRVHAGTHLTVQSNMESHGISSVSRVSRPMFFRLNGCNGPLMDVCNCPGAYLNAPDFGLKQFHIVSPARCDIYSTNLVLQLQFSCKSRFEFMWMLLLCLDCTDTFTHVGYSYKWRYLESNS